MQHLLHGLPWGSDGKVSACNVGDLGSIPGLGRSPGEGNANPLQYSCLKWMEEPGRLQSMGLQSQTQLSDFTFTTWQFSHGPCTLSPL